MTVGSGFAVVSTTVLAVAREVRSGKSEGRGTIVAPTPGGELSVKVGVTSETGVDGGESSPDSIPSLSESDMSSSSSSAESSPGIPSLSPSPSTAPPSPTPAPVPLCLDVIIRAPPLGAPGNRLRLSDTASSRARNAGRSTSFSDRFHFRGRPVRWLSSTGGIVVSRNSLSARSARLPQFSGNRRRKIGGSWHAR